MVLRQSVNLTCPDNIDVSICIANYNGADIITACIDSVLGQSGNLSIEIIVHDDASTDRSLETIRDNYPGKVRLITSTSNVGFCVSNNRMVEIARGRYILLLNNDAILFKDALSALYKAANQRQDCILTLPQYDVANGQLLDCGMAMDLFANPIPLNTATEREVAMVMGACLWIPRALWQMLEGFPEWFGSIGEDMYLCCFSRLAGYPVIALAHSGYWHHVGHSFGGGKLTEQQKLQSSFKRRALSESNKTKVILIFYPISILVVLAPMHFFLLLAEGILLTLLRRDYRIFKIIYWPVIVTTICNINTIAQHRSIVQTLRSTSSRIFFRQFQIFPHKLKMLIKYGLPTIH